MKISQRFLNLLLIPLLLAVMLPSNAASAAQTTTPPADPFTPSARRALAALAPGQKGRFIITLSDQLLAAPGPGQLAPLQAAAAAEPTRAARQALVIGSLQSHAAATQAALLAQANTLQSQQQADQIVSFWIFNGISLQATPGAMRALAALPGIARISPDPDPDAVIVPLESAPKSQSRPAWLLPAGPAPEPNVAMVNAPALWAMGYTGQGVVVASMDTGVDFTHPDLAASFRGGANSWFDPYNQNAAPVDFSADGHGTMTMGLMVGDSAGGTAIGMAPGAKWIAAKIFDNNRTYTDTAIHQAFQWIINPNNDLNNTGAPDVVNNSWGYSNGGNCITSFQPDILALAAAGIVPVFSAGNAGAATPSDVSPANNAGTFAVGAIGSDSTLAYFSSRGPSSCDTTLLYPRLVAPGLLLRSSVPNSLYSVCTGTSCAAPEVSGAFALLLSALPHLGLTLQEQAVSQSAVDLGPAGYDFSFGYGRLDVLAAYNWLVSVQHLLVAPGGLGADPVAPDRINLNWIDNNLLIATGYQVERSADGSTGWVLLATTPQGQTSYGDASGLSEGTPYYYRVRAVNAGLGSASPYAEVQTVTPLLAPTHFSATILGDQIYLTWTNASAHTTGFELQRSPSIPAVWTTIAMLPAGATQYTDPLQPGQPAVYYRVRATGPLSNSAYTPTIAAATAPFQHFMPRLDNTALRRYWFAVIFH